MSGGSPANEREEFFRHLDGFENRELLEFRLSCRDILMWPLVRWEFVSRALTRHYGFQTAHSASPPLPLSGKLSYAFNAWRRRPSGLRHYPVLWFASAIGAVIRKEGKWFGRINDYLIDLLPGETLLIEDAYHHKFKWPRSVANLRFHDYIRLRAAARSKLFRSPGSRDRESIRALIDHLRRKFPTRLADDDYTDIESRLLMLVGRMPYYYDAYRRLFDEVRPKVIFQEDACYGSQAYIIKWAKEAGIRTAEFQHGAIVPTHPAYNFGPLAFDPEYAEYLPDTLLTHGEFWSLNTRIPSAKMVVGNPHFQANLENVERKREQGGSRRLLVVSQGDVTDRLVKLTQEILALPADFEIVFRLHPGEVAFEERYRALVGVERVAISKSGDIYDLIGSSDWIVGVSSTTLFEAAGLGKPAFVYDTPQARLYIPRNFGTWFADARDLLTRIGGGSEYSGIPLESIWARDWRRNFLKFIQSEIGILPGT